jgi:beta-lactam-binding protein with PASTA domain
VDLLLSLGPEGGIYLVPDLRRRDLDGALALLEGSAVARPRIRYREVGSAPTGVILEQSPPPGSRLWGGRTLELVVASQPR